MSLKKILTCFLLFFVPLQAIDFNEEGQQVSDEKEPLFVSLGYFCHIAIATRDVGLRKTAMPFDWLVTAHYQGLIDVLNDRFEHFTDINCFAKQKGKIAPLNKYYRFGFPHDFNPNNLSEEEEKAQWLKFKNKYDRRIERFLNLNNYKGKVFFIRNFWSQPAEGTHGEFENNTQYSKGLREALDRLFPSLDFTLIIWSYEDLNIPEMEPIPGVIEFRIDRSHQTFLNKVKELLKQLKLPMPPKYVT